jgi:signal transduction histidine kinase
MFKLNSFFARLIVSYFLVVAFVVAATIAAMSIESQLWRILCVLFAFLLGIGLGGIFTVLHNNLMVKPMKEIIEVTNKVSKGEFGTRSKVQYADKNVSALAYNFNKMANEFENLEQMRKSFVANASHELKSPLTSIQGFIQGMLDGTIGDVERNKCLNIVFSETKRLSAMINNMLDLSRIESGRFPIVKARFEINELIRRVVIRFETHMLKKNITLDICFENEFSYVYADKERIEQVLVNLIDNAIKYSGNNTKVQITTQIQATKIFISIKDEGVGLSKKDQLLIWDRFFTVDKARTPGKSKGTGLGLSIVKKIIDEHREVIFVESAIGQGTTFRFTLSRYNPNIHGLDAGEQQS